MTSKEKLIALQEIQDMQKRIEDLELVWRKTYDDGLPMEAIDRDFDKLLAQRRGMEELMKALNIKFDRRDYRHVEPDGAWEIHTEWYLL